ncbi:Orotidine 5'-phosphate decarboxylase, partial [Dissostichus eleginoides]
VAEVFEEVPEIFKVLKILEEILEGVPCAFEKVTKVSGVGREVLEVMEVPRRMQKSSRRFLWSSSKLRINSDDVNRQLAANQSAAFPRETTVGGGGEPDFSLIRSKESEFLQTKRSWEERKVIWKTNRVTHGGEIDRSPGQSQPSVAPPLKADRHRVAENVGPRLTQETVTTVQNSLNSSPSHLPIPSPYPKTPHPTQGDAGLRSGSAGRRVPSDHTQNQGGFVMKGTKRVTCTHPLTHSDPSRGPSPGLPLPGQPSPGLSSPKTMALAPAVNPIGNQNTLYLLTF